MARNITLILGNGLGTNLGPNFNITSDAGAVSPPTATKSELLAGLIVSVNDATTSITVTSTGPCTNSITQSLPCPPLTTTTTSLPPIVIDENTEIIIWFDNSGSMNSTLAPLQIMRDTILRDCLVQFYGGDYNLYDQNVTVRNFSSKTSGLERTLFMLNTTGSSAAVTKIINLVFQDEAIDVYHPDPDSFDENSPRTAQYDIDLAAFRTTLSNVPTNDYYRGIVFRVLPYTGFRQFLVAVKDGLGNYSGTNGLSDKSEIAYELDITAASTPQYYADQIIAGLNTLGYNLSPC